MGPLWVYGSDFSSLWEHYGMIVESLWAYEGPFSKNIHPTHFNDFIKLFGGLWVDLGLIWDRFWHMKVNLGPLWGHFGVTFFHGQPLSGLTQPSYNMVLTGL